MSNSERQITTSKALKEIKNTDGKIFYAEFIKRSTGELRKMWARLGVTEYLKGGDKPYNAEEKNLVTVFDMKKQGYRSIPLENLLKLSANNNRYKVREGGE